MFNYLYDWLLFNTYSMNDFYLQNFIRLIPNSI